MLMKTPRKLPTSLTLSVRQPSAHLILTESQRPGVPVKWIENRTWEPKRLRNEIERNGKATILIHASGTYGKSQSYRYYGLSTDIPHSAIIGHVDVVGWELCIGNENQRHEGAIWWMKQEYKRKTGLSPLGGDEHFADRMGVYWWMLANPVMYKTPITGILGQLNLWTFKR